MGPFMLTLLAYHLNKQVRNMSNAVIGHYFEPARDIVCITGGCLGLGYEIAKQILEKGAKTVVLDINLPKPEMRLRGVHYYVCDVSNCLQVLQVQKRISKEVGSVTVLINNAGISYGKKILDLKYEEIEKTINVNLLSSFYTIKAFLPEMLNLKRGYVVTVASVLGYMSPARLSDYGASKSGLIALHESLTYELGPPSISPNGIKTLLICPGQLSKTRMFSSIQTPSQLFAPELDPSFVAKKLLHSIELGRRGEIKLPFYGNFMPIMRAVPWPVVEVLRDISGMDKSMVNFASKIYSSLNASEESLQKVGTETIEHDDAGVVDERGYSYSFDSENPYMQ